MSAFWASVTATVLISLISLTGAAILRGRLWNPRNELRVISFAAGVLLATVFLDLLPQAVHEAKGSTTIFTGALFAMAAFFFIERFAHGRHAHQGDESHIHHHTTSSYFILMGDGVHNFVDGVAIGVSFLIEPGLGIATTLAVAAHELPHEIADYGILRRTYSAGRALLYNLLSGLTAVLGAVSVFLFGEFVENHLAIFISATAGMFIYIAAVNLMPELHHQRVKGRLLYGAPFLIGIALIALVLTVIPHEHHDEPAGGQAPSSAE